MSRDVVVDVVVIARTTPVEGTVVAARPASWGVVSHHAVPAFAFVQTTALDGQSIRLRATNGYGQVNVGNYHRDLQRVRRTGRAGSPR
ncbi:MAG TPA: hypothetical protein VLV86_06195 [Vicinamibacterales bacterium]|nr:hypothetical protein [Vicinamibacterales bacterium]